MARCHGINLKFLLMWADVGNFKSPCPCFPNIHEVTPWCQFLGFGNFGLKKHQHTVRDQRNIETVCCSNTSVEIFISVGLKKLYRVQFLYQSMRYTIFYICPYKYLHLLL